MAQKKEFKEIWKLCLAHHHMLTIACSKWIQRSKVAFDSSLLNLVEVVEMIKVRC
uniref:Uncharacterized protein n=1 Tax=Medicago truncatula TaxID=3880 RepID=A2Q1M8_MEDTR|nr:hypothetical protein MtrDRAFT_AC148970g31v2 [Medicago truncatula]